MSQFKLKNKNGKTLTINNDSDTQNRVLEIDKVTSYVADRVALQTKVGTVGDVVFQKDIALPYEWVEPQQVVTVSAG